MQTELLVALGLGLPLLGTALGAAGALGLRWASERGERLALGFAAEVMLAASVWSLLLPAIDAAAARSLPPWWPAVGGFLAGTLALGLLRRAAERRFGGGARRRVFLLACSVTLHNIPEGMAVGAALASALAGDAPLMGALALSFGIAVQNVPEGGVIALPLALVGRGFFWLFLGGVCYTVGGVIYALKPRRLARLIPGFGNHEIFHVFVMLGSAAHAAVMFAGLPL